MTNQIADLPAVPDAAICVHEPLTEMALTSAPDPAPLGTCGRHGFLFRVSVDDGTVLWAHAASRTYVDDWARWMTPDGHTAVVDGPSGPSTVNADGTITHQPPVPSGMLEGVAARVAAELGADWADGLPYPTVAWGDEGTVVHVVDVDGAVALVVADGVGSSLPVPVAHPSDADDVRARFAAAREALDGRPAWGETSVWLVDVPLRPVTSVVPDADVSQALSVRLEQRPLLRVGGSDGGMLDVAAGPPAAELVDVVDVAVSGDRSRAAVAVRARVAGGVDGRQAAAAFVHRFADSAMLWLDGDDPSAATGRDYEVVEVDGVPTATALPLRGRARTDAVRALQDVGTDRRRAGTAVDQLGGVRGDDREAVMWLLADLAAGSTSATAIASLLGRVGVAAMVDGHTVTVLSSSTPVAVDVRDLSTFDVGNAPVESGLPSRCPNPWRVASALAELSG